MTTVQENFAKWVEASRDPAELVLGVPGFAYADLFDPARLADLTAAFDRHLAAADPAAHAAFARYRDAKGEGLGPVETSSALLAAAPHLSTFVARLFGVEAEHGALLARARDEEPIWQMKKAFAKKRLFKADAGKALAAAPATVVAALARAALLAAEFRDAMLVSTRDPADVARVRQLVVDWFDRDLEETPLIVPYAKSQVRARVFEEARVLEETWGDDGATMRVRGEPATLARLRAELG